MADAITIKALQDASLDAKSLEEVVNGNEVKQITTRKGETYPSVKKAIKDMFENGGLPATPFKTKTLMLASALVDGDYAQVTDDTVNNGLYVKEAGAWVKSAYDPLTVSALKDELPKHVSYETNWYEAHPPEASLWEDATIVTGMYIKAGTVTANASTSLAYMPVTAGKAYLFPTATTNIVACFINSQEDIKAGAKLRQASLEGFQSSHPLLDKQIVVIPDGVEYLAFNVKLTGFDFTQVAEIYEVDYFIDGLLGKDIGDGKLRDLINETTFINETYPILAIAVSLDNRYVKVSTDVVGSSAGTRIEVVPVEKGGVYTIYTPDAGAIAWGIWDSDSTNPTGTLTAYYGMSAPAGSNPNCEVLGGGLFQITIPETSGGFICFNTIVPSGNYNVSGEVIVVKGAYDFVPRNTIDTLFGLEVEDSFARKELSKLTGDVQINSPLSGKTWIVIGDSITQKNYRATLNYYDYIDTDVGGMTKIIKGYSGQGFVSKVNLPDELTTVNPDYITIALGTNDSTGGVPLGDFLSTDTGTISGCINTFITKLLNKYPLSKIAFFTPLPRKTSYGSNATKNSMGYALIDVVILIKKYADHYSLPCLDLYHASNLHPWIPAANEHFFSIDSVPLGDGVHPNDAGQRVMADKIRPFLESL